MGRPLLINTYSSRNLKTSISQELCFHILEYSTPHYLVPMYVHVHTYYILRYVEPVSPYAKTAKTVPKLPKLIDILQSRGFWHLY